MGNTSDKMINYSALAEQMEVPKVCWGLTIRQGKPYLWVYLLQGKYINRVERQIPQVNTYEWFNGFQDLAKNRICCHCYSFNGLIPNHEEYVAFRKFVVFVGLSYYQHFITDIVDSIYAYNVDNPGRLVVDYQKE